MFLLACSNMITFVTCSLLQLSKVTKNVQPENNAFTRQQTQEKSAKTNHAPKGYVAFKK